MLPAGPSTSSLFPSRAARLASLWRPTATSHSPASSPWRHVAHSPLAFPPFIEKLIDQRGVRASAEPANGRADRAEQFELAVDGLELPHVLPFGSTGSNGGVDACIQIYCSATQMLIESSSHSTRLLGDATARSEQSTASNAVKKLGRRDVGDAKADSYQ